MSAKERFTSAFAKLFSYLTPEQSTRLLDQAELKSYRPGDVIVREGYRLEGLYILVSGEVDVVQNYKTAGPRDEGSKLARLGTGSIFGEMSFLEQDRASATIIAADKVELYFVAEEIVRSAITGSKAFAANFYQSLAIILSRRLRVTNSLLRSSEDAGKADLDRDLKFYVVDDDPDVAQLMTLFLESGGHTVMSNISATVAIPEIVSFRPDCILTDLMMPEMDGIEFCKELRRRKELEDTKIIMISKWSENTWADRASSAGADGYIRKPLNVDSFLDQVMKIVEG